MLILILMILMLMLIQNSRHGIAPRSKLAPHAAAVAVSNAALIETRGAHSVSPTRTLRSASASHADASAAPAKDHLSMGRVLEGGDLCDTTPRVASAALADVGPGMPVVRRHSYTIGGKPRCVLVPVCG